MRKEEVERQTPRHSKHLKSEHRKKKPAKKAEMDHLFTSSFTQQVNIGHLLGTRHCFTHWNHRRRPVLPLLELFQKYQIVINTHNWKRVTCGQGLDGHWNKIGQLL